MKIPFHCTHCGAKHSVSEKTVGRELPCPACGQLFVVARPNEASSDHGQSDLADNDGDVLEDADLGLADHDQEAVELGQLGDENIAQLPTRPHVSEQTPNDRAQVEDSKIWNKPLVIAGLAGCGVLLLLVMCGGLGAAALLFSRSGDNALAERSRTPSPDATSTAQNGEPSGQLGTTARNQAHAVTLAAPPEVSPAKASVEQSGQGTDSLQATLDRLKAATVFIKVTTSAGTQTGSGFLFEAAGSRGLIVTNAHVVEPEEGSLDGITCVFHSGSREEFQATATIDGKDVGNDIAVLSVIHDSLPLPIESVDDVQLRETSTVLVLGFPFGESLTTSSRNPAITVSKGTISSIRRDNYENVVLFQTDGGINPGNSGGPVVTEDGKLAGISVAKVRGADIGFAIPRRQLIDAMLGRVATISVQQTIRRGSESGYSFTVNFIDPKQHIKSAALVVFDEGSQTRKAPGANGRWKQAADSALQEQRLQIKDSQAVTQVKVPTSGHPRFQIRWTRKDGSEHFTPPTRFDMANMPHSIVSASPGSAAPREPPRITPQVPKRVEEDLPAEEPAIVAEVSNDLLVNLPTLMADFAINPRNGDIATVDPIAHRAYLIRASSLAAGKVDAPSQVSLGDTPIAITYKRFGSMEMFAAVCTQDSHMYIIDVTKFIRLHKIPLAGKGVSSVTASSNPKDPFIYYSYGAGHASLTGAVDLREMVDRGEVFDDSMDCAISADGRIAYRRGPFSPSGFESLVMLSEFTDEKPSFAKLFYAHRSCGAFIPDPFGEYTASHSSVFSKGLEKHVATLSFIPQCFFRTKPVLIGLDGLNLRAVSYNTMSDVGIDVKLPDGAAGEATPLPRGVRGGDFKHVGLKRRVLADDKNARVVYGFRDSLVIVPLTVFDLPDDPFITLEVGDTDLKVGLKQTTSLKTPDPRVSISCDALPDGATKTAEGIEWTPRDEHVGTTTVPVKLSFGRTDRLVEVELRITQPFVPSPIEIAGFTLDAETTQAICWTGPELDRSGRPISVNRNKPTTRKHFLAVVPLRGGKESRRTELSDSAKQVILFGSNIAVLPATEGSQVDIYDVESLERIKSLLSTSVVTGIGFEYGKLRLDGDRSSQDYDPKTFEPVRKVASKIHAAPSGNADAPRFIDGVLIDGVLYDKPGGERKLLINAAKIPSLNGADARLFTGSFLRRGDAATASTVADSSSSPDFRVTLQASAKQVLLNNSVYERRTQRTVALVVTSQDGTERIPVVEEMLVQNINVTSPTPPRMEVAGDLVFVSVGRRIFRWSAPQNKAAESATKEEPVVEFHIAPEQSTFGLRDGKTSLSHSPRGGKAPYEFFLVTQLKGVTLDEETGVVTIDQPTLLGEAVPIFENYAAGAADEAEAAQWIQAAAIELFEPAVQLLGRKPKGFPIAVPIQLKAIDDRGKVAQIQYFVLMEASYRQAAAKLRAQRAE